MWKYSWHVGVGKKIPNFWCSLILSSRIVFLEPFDVLFIRL